MRRDVEFKTLDGITLRGWLYEPEQRPAPWPVVVMAHGFSAVKEMYLDAFAEVFAASGLAALVYDNRNLGASDGQPRQEVDRTLQIRDYLDAITYAAARPDIDPERIGVWGSSFSGGHVLVVGAIDRRVKCVVSQVPASDPIATLRYIDARTTERYAAERRRRAAGEPPTMIAVISDDPSTECLLPTHDAFEWFTTAAAKRAPAWRNEVTLLSGDHARLVHPGDYAPYVSPTPLLMVVAENDVVAPTGSAIDAYTRAAQPKELVILPGGHFDPYVGKFEESSCAARDWFKRHLCLD